MARRVFDWTSRWADRLAIVLFICYGVSGFIADVIDAVNWYANGHFTPEARSRPAMDAVFLAGLPLTAAAIIGYPSFARFRIVVLVLFVLLGHDRLHWLLPIATTHLLALAWPHYVCLAAATAAYVLYARPTAWRALIMLCLVFFGFTSAVAYLGTTLVR